MPIVDAPNQQALQALSHDRSHGSDVGGDLGRPIPLLVPRQEVAGE